MSINNIDDRDLDYVAKHYKEGAFDVQKAIITFRSLTGETKSLHYRFMAFAASIIIIIGIFAGYRLFSTDKTNIILASGDSIKTYALQDGSEITLYPHSCISYNKNDMNKSHRSVNLKGKAYFVIHHDSKRPFTVYGDIGMVKVLGTVFQVDELKRDLSVLYVVSGKVDFSSRQNNKGVLLTKGMKAELMCGNHKPQIVSSGNINQTAWATGIFKFHNTPINEALGDLSEYYHVNLVAVDSSESISGEFEATSLNEVKDILESTLNIRIYIKK